VLGRHQDRATPLATDGHPLQYAQRDEGDRRPDTDLPVGRERTDQEARDAHQGHRRDEHLLPPDAVTEVAEQDPAERPGEIARRERAEARHGGGEGVERGEEHLSEHHRGGGGVEQEVVVLDHAPDEAGGDRASELDGGMGGDCRVRHGRASLRWARARGYA
jgi:hypothetical protein